MALCHCGKLSTWDVVTMKNCHHGMLSPCQVVTMACYHHGKLSPWKGVTMAGCHLGNLSPWQLITMERCHHGRVSPRHVVTVESCHNVITGIKLKFPEKIAFHEIFFTWGTWCNTDNIFDIINIFLRKYSIVNWGVAIVMRLSVVQDIGGFLF